MTVLEQALDKIEREQKITTRTSSLSERAQQGFDQFVEEQLNNPQNQGASQNYWRKGVSGLKELAAQEKISYQSFLVNGIKSLSQVKALLLGVPLASALELLNETIKIEKQNITNLNKQL